MNTQNEGLLQGTEVQAQRGQFVIGSGSEEGDKWVGLGLSASLEFCKFKGRNSVRNCI